MSEENVVKQAMAQMLGAAKPPPAPPPAAEMVARLRDEHTFYQRRSTLKAGDLITPRKGTYGQDAGTPYIVLDVRPPGAVEWAPELAGTMRDGFIPDIRVGKWTQFGMAVAWVESWAFETYEEKSNEQNDERVPVGKKARHHGRRAQVAA